MKKRLISILLCLVLLTVTTVVQVSVSADVDMWDGAAVSSALAGAGTEEDPFIIATAADLACFAGKSRGGDAFKGKYIRLDGDISLGNLTFSPLGGFSGNFDGNGHKISGININATTDNIGFFSGIVEGTVKDLTLAGSITTTGAFVGGFAGYAVSANFIDCVNNLNVTGRAKVGGFCGGVNSGDYTNVIACTNNGNITATNTSNYSFLGGFIGAIVSICTVNITESQNTGHIYSEQRNVVGGFVGQNLGTLTVENCINSGIIEGLTQIGGIVANVNNEAVSLTVKNTINVGTLKTIRTTGQTAHIGAILGYYAEKANSET
ncbi:MAG: hypothetical protein J5662_07365, partial [Clostridia bacterium]|nr:hypothetical protein [Clostridia bacterium]